jgi:prepilin-type N-terminal cleavage/methylation domain-containing protein/prepilin-type processing-associated H-X9-DG protein
MIGPPPTGVYAVRSWRRGLAVSGFTLVELLVVVGIIALLASLLLPSLSAAQQRARAVNCIGNLRQLGIGFRMYVEDAGSFPLATSGDGLGNWQRALRPITGEKVFYCPQRVKATDEFRQIFPTSEAEIAPHYGYNFIGSTERNPLPLNPGLGGDYAWNGASGQYVPAPEKRVRVPSQMIAFGDSAAFIRPGLATSASVTTSDPLYIAFPFVFPTWGYAGVGDWHGGKAALLFCDGHTESKKQSVWMQAAPQSRCLWNNDNLPHPETW